MLPPKSTDAAQTLELYFLETRARLLEIAANLDRVDRAPNRAALAGDSRLAFIQAALVVLQSEAPQRAERIQRLYSKD